MRNSNTREVQRRVDTGVGDRPKQPIPITQPPNYPDPSIGKPSRGGMFMPYGDL